MSINASDAAASTSLARGAPTRPLRILVTGSEGLLGTCLLARLRASGHLVSALDLRAPDTASRGDARNGARLRRAIDDRDGVVHLAAVSRVVWGERRPSLCWDTNVGVLRDLLRFSLASPRPPWIIFASSREVYGQPARLPANEETPLAPVNTYGRSKQEGERLCAEAIAAGLRVSIVRFSNVFGLASDHHDRVVPAFVRAALGCDPLRVDGADNTFDFTHVDDAVAGVVGVIELIEHGEVVPPLHFLTGVPTTLAELAERIVHLSRSSAPILAAGPRSFDVARFYGDPSRARALLGWRPRVNLETGLARLIDDVRDLGRRAPAASEPR